MSNQLYETESQGILKTFNLGLLFSTLGVFTLGMITLFSATHGPGIQNLYRIQLLWFGLGTLFAVGILFIDSDMMRKFSYVIYGITLICLFLVMFVGEVGNGSQRWLKLGFFRMQPSELAKIAIVFAFARYFADDEKGAPYPLRRLIVPGVMVAPMFLLILLQPDIGTAGILFLTAASMALFLKINWRSLLIVFFIAIVAIPTAYRFFLREYQRQRVLTFLDPGRDPKGSGYNAIQCKIAVGSGKLFGKGYLKGTQAQLNFIPEQHTDFIFSVFAEERGFIGGLVLLILYYLYIYYGMRTVARSRDKFEMLLSFGLTAMIFWHVLINIGMVCGILPIVGVTLPFFSYGGSSLVCFLIATGLLLNLGRKRYIF